MLIPIRDDYAPNVHAPLPAYSDAAEQQDWLDAVMMRQSLTFLFRTLFVAAFLGATTISCVSSALAQSGGDPNGRAKIRFNARLFYDYAHYDYSDRQSISESRPSSLRLGISGQPNSDIRYILQWELKEWFRDTGQESQLRYATISYKIAERLEVEFGQTDEPFGLEATTSIRNATFMERSLPFVFVPFYHVGSVLHFRDRKRGGAIGVFGKTVGQTQHDEGYGVSGRIFGDPVVWDDVVMHLGAGFSFRNPKSNAVRYRTRPESSLTEDRLVDTGNILGVKDIQTLGLESAYVEGPFAYSGEYFFVRLSRDEGRNARFDGGYVGLSYFVTDDTKNFSSSRGVFTDIKPRSSRGALEFALRYSVIDLNDQSIRGREQRNVTVGVNWYINQKTRLMLNAIFPDSTKPEAPKMTKILQARFQVEL